MPHVEALFTYPLKSGAPIAHQTCELLARGLRHDRHWMVVDESGTFVTQRTHPRLARITTEFHQDGTTEHVTFRHENARWSSPVGHGQQPLVSVTVWKSTVLAADQGNRAALWFGDVLGARVRLVYFSDASRRATSRDPEAQVGFADGYPLLVVSRESLDDLNARLAVPVDADRFRANVIVSGGGRPYWEDDASALTLGGIPVSGVKKCVRCPVIQIDQAEGRRAGSEPTKTLLTYRRIEVEEDGRLMKKTYFGINAIPRATGTLSVGDDVVVTDEAPVPF